MRKNSTNEIVVRKLHAAWEQQVAPDLPLLKMEAYLGSVCYKGLYNANLFSFVIIIPHLVLSVLIGGNALKGGNAFVNKMKIMQRS